MVSATNVTSLIFSISAMKGRAGVHEYELDVDDIVQLYGVEVSAKHVFVLQECRKLTVIHRNFEIIKISEGPRA